MKFVRLMPFSGCSEFCCLRRWHASFMLESLLGSAQLPGCRCCKEEAFGVATLRICSREAALTVFLSDALRLMPTISPI